MLNSITDPAYRFALLLLRTVTTRMLEAGTPWRSSSPIHPSLRAEITLSFHLVWMTVTRTPSDLSPVADAIPLMGSAILGKIPETYVTPGPTFDDTPVSACSSSEFLALWLFALCQTGVRLELSICSNKSNSSLAAVIPMLYRKLPRRPASLRRWVSTVSKPFFVTTPIFYVNGDPHLGHLFSSMLAE